MLRYYRESGSDYLVVNYADYAKLVSHDGEVRREGRATAIKGDPSSMSTTAIAESYLKEECKPVAKRDVPQEWLDWINL